jgi:hypothetical protein
MRAARFHALAAALALLALHAQARANGRMPGATELAISRSDPDHLLARATFGLVQSFDGGASWQWVCEQALQVSGDADPLLALTADGSLVLLPPGGGALISHDAGCTFSPAPAPLAGANAVDLTIDPSDPARVLVAASTIDDIDDRGVITYVNALIETRDDAASWSELARLPPDFRIETLEIAPSDPRRIYVSGTATSSPLLGVIERSEDGGATWTRTTLDLPATSGSLFIGAIDPTNPDRLWVRLPAQGDRLGYFPASLLVSSDKGESFAMLAATSRAGMLGLAVSPDGTRLAFGGPADGLYVGPSGGTGEFTQVAGVRVRCLRWNGDGLYACGIEPSDAFSVGLSVDEGASFDAVYSLSDTCPQQCADATPFAITCQPSWSNIEPALEAPGDRCEVRWPTDAALPDAGSDAGPRDAAAPRADAAADAGTPPRGTPACGCRVPGGRPRTRGAAAWGMLVLLVLALRRRVRR